MKKRILIAMPSLSAGGGEKSLINLLNQFNYSHYHIDLFLFSPSGVFLDSLPSEVNILNLPRNYTTFTKPFNVSFKNFIENSQFNLAVSRLLFTVQSRLMKNTAVCEQKNWKYFQKSLERLESQYDAAIGYLEKSSIYFIVDKVVAKRKIGWIHTNYMNSGMRNDLDKPYFEQLDYLVTVSNECQSALKSAFPHLEDRFKIIKNIVSPSLIKKFSNKSLKEERLFEKGVIHLITVARLSYEKGVDLAITACKNLVNNGYNIKWFVIGDGNEKDKLNLMIERNHLSKYIVLLGVRENPYPYIKNADIYVQPSRVEGKSIALDEAKILSKPIVITNFSTAKDQIENYKNGLIVDMNSEGISNGIEELVNNTALQDSLVKNLESEYFGTEDEIEKLYKIL